MDLALADNSADFEKYRAYVPGVKIISVWRDPRDVYAEGRKLNERWIPEDLETFVTWYLSSLPKYLALNEPDHLMIRFEDLVLKYDETVAKIEAFSGLTPEGHNAPKSCYDPAVSARNIGLWRTYGDRAVLKQIEERLGQYLYRE